MHGHRALPMDSGALAAQRDRIVVIGSGIAGLTVALQCARAGRAVALVTKKRLEDSSTNWAQGGIAGVLNPDDNAAIERHIEDTIESGCGMADEDTVRWVVREAAERIRELVGEGVKFDRGSDGDYDLTREGGHSSRRILHARDRTGAVIEGTLIDRLAEQDVLVLQDTMVIDLVLRDRGVPGDGITGVWCLDSNGDVRTIEASSVVIATGGAGQLWRETTNPSVATGDGIAIAHRAGAAVRNLEFVQFHPTALAVPDDRPFLITEAMRGAGAVLMSIESHAAWIARTSESKGGDSFDDGEGEHAYAKSLAETAAAASFMAAVDPRGSLATRDIVARATDIEMKRSGASHVLLATEHLDAEELKDRFPTISARLDRHGISIGADPIPVTPAAHYLVGGLAVDREGRVLAADSLDPLPGLYAVGEVACTGLHGANRLASNSLLEAVVFAHRTVQNLIDSSDRVVTSKVPAWRAEGLADLVEHAPLKSDREALRATMSDDVGLVRSDARLHRAARRITFLTDEIERLWRTSKPTFELVELRNMAIVAGLVTDAAQRQTENIGLHHNIDLE